jgi:hypothetical protein
MPAATDEAFGSPGSMTTTRRPRLAPPLTLKRALGHIISCKDASRLVSEREDGPLSAWQRLVLRLHLSVGAACARFERRVAFLRTAMQRYRQ